MASRRVCNETASIKRLMDPCQASTLAMSFHASVANMPSSAKAGSAVKLPWRSIRPLATPDLRHKRQALDLLRDAFVRQDAKHAHCTLSMLVPQ